MYGFRHTFHTCPGKYDRNFFIQVRILSILGPLSRRTDPILLRCPETMAGHRWCQCRKCLGYCGGRIISKTAWYLHNPQRRRTSGKSSHLAGSSIPATGKSPPITSPTCPTDIDVKDVHDDAGPSNEAGRAARSDSVGIILQSNQSPASVEHIFCRVTSTWRKTAEDNKLLHGHPDLVPLYV